MYVSNAWRHAKSLNSILTESDSTEVNQNAGRTPPTMFTSVNSTVRCDYKPFFCFSISHPSIRSVKRLHGEGSISEISSPVDPREQA